MSERSTGERPSAELPPGWTVLNSSTTYGHLYVAVWRAFHDATPWEYGFAMASPPNLGWIHASDAVTRVRALREARAQRPDLSDNTWQELVDDKTPSLSERQRKDPEAILAAVQRRIDATAEVSGPTLGRGRLADKSRRRLKLEAALDQCRDGRRPAPTQAEIAGACEPQVNERTVRRWLTVEPGLRELMPWLRGGGGQNVRRMTGS